MSSHSSSRTTRASVTRLRSILRHHPDTAMLAILALAYPTPPGNSTHLEVGVVKEETGDSICVSLEWTFGLDSAVASGFNGELKAFPDDEGARLELIGHVRGGSSETDSLGRVLGWLALAAESAPIAGDTR